MTKDNVITYIETHTDFSTAQIYPTTVQIVGDVDTQIETWSIHAGKSKSLSVIVRDSQCDQIKTVSFDDNGVDTIIVIPSDTEIENENLEFYRTASEKTHGL